MLRLPRGAAPPSSKLVRRFQNSIIDQHIADAQPAACKAAAQLKRFANGSF